jgi:hypothetical protein
VQPRPFQLRLGGGFRFDGRIDHAGLDIRKNGLDFGEGAWMGVRGDVCSYEKTGMPRS